MVRYLMAVFTFFLIGLVMWYLTIRPYDFTISFKANTTPSNVKQYLKLWSKTMSESEKLTLNSSSNLTQQIYIDNSVYKLDWSAKMINDTTSYVKVHVDQEDGSVYKRLIIPFLNTESEQDVLDFITNVKSGLDSHLETFKVEGFSLDSLPTIFCAFISLRGLQIDKAEGMMMAYPELSALLIENNISQNGDPFVEILHWDLSNDSQGKRT